MKKQYRIYYLAALIAGLTVAVYLKTLKNGFVFWDDDRFVYENLNIRSFDFPMLKWAVTDLSFDFWQPLAWISFAFDYLVWGLNPFGYHLTSILLHAANTLLTVLLVAKLLEQASASSREKGTAPPLDPRSILVAAGVTGLLFGIHPLHVETVALISARNDIIATFFLLLCFFWYIRQSVLPRSATPGRSPHRFLPVMDYLVVTFFFILALASKPTAVILPPVLILLDWHPLGRIRSRADAVASIVNKLPLIALSLSVSLTTFLLHQSRGGILPEEVMPLGGRLLLAAKSLVVYLSKMVLPLHLIPYYPLPGNVSILKAEYPLAVMAVCLITVGCLFSARRQRTLLAVWIAYLVILLPVIGIVSVREVAMADRYTYLSGLGPFLLAGLGAAWLWRRVDALSRRRNGYKVIACTLALLVVASLVTLTLRQISIWNNTISLWSYVIEQGPYRVPIAFNNRGTAYFDKGETELALKDYNSALDLDPNYAYAYYNRGVLYAGRGLADAAMADFTRAISLKPTDYAPYFKRGLLFEDQGAPEPALADFTMAIKLNPAIAETYINRGAVLRALGNIEQALMDYGTALELDPANYLAYCNRGVALVWAGRGSEAVGDFTRAIALNPRYAKAYLYRAGVYERSGRIQQAREDYRVACSLGSEEGCSGVSGEKAPGSE